jgi:hypothetical protein
MKDIFKLVDQKLQALREAEEQPKKDSKEATSVKFDVQTSFPKDEATAKAAVAQLQSGDPNASIFKAMEKTEKNKETGEEKIVKVDPAIRFQNQVYLKKICLFYLAHRMLKVILKM